MMPKFNAKEIHFLKSDDPLSPPETYLSDLVFSKPDALANLEQRLTSDREREDNFVCAILQIPERETEEEQDQASQICETGLDALLNKNRGIWEALDHRTFALVYWDFKQKKKALRVLDTIIENISSGLKADVLCGLSWFPHREDADLDCLSNALKALDHAAFFGKDHRQEFDAVSLNISGDRRYQSGDCRTAVAEYKAGLALEPKNVNLLNSLGVCHGVMGDVELAAGYFEKALALNPNEIMVIYNMALIHQINELEDKAVLFLRKAHGIDPEVFEVELLLGHLMHKAGKTDQALPHLDRAIELNTQSGAALTVKGDILLEQEKPAEAGKLFGEAVKRNPGNARAISGYAISMALQKKNLSIALSFARESVTLDPGSPLFQERLETIEQLCNVQDTATAGEEIKSA